MEYENFIEINQWPEGITEEQKQYFISYVKHRCEEKTRLWVIYHPDCGCPVDQFVLLDRYPMSPKIISTCPECEKGVLMEISDPIIFHLPLTGQDFNLEDLKKYHINESPQKWLIERYKSHCSNAD